MLSELIVDSVLLVVCSLDFGKLLMSSIHSSVVSLSSVAAPTINSPDSVFGYVAISLAMKALCSIFASCCARKWTLL